MDITIRRATLADIDDLAAIEASAATGPGYVYDNRFFFLSDDSENVGEMTIAFADGEPAGMGQISVMPDGTSWLETLRVKREFHRRGIGRRIYERYLELAHSYGSKSAAMFTGWKNVASRALAELFGFSLAGEYAGFDIPLDLAHDDGSFKRVDDADEAEELFVEAAKGWGRFAVFNRTFMHHGRPLTEYLCRRSAIWSDGSNAVALGARMLAERGLHIGIFAGDAEKIFAFAAAETARRKLPKLSIMFPTDRGDLIEIAEASRATRTLDLIAMERPLTNQ